MTRSRRYQVFTRCGKQFTLRLKNGFSSRRYGKVDRPPIGSRKVARVVAGTHPATLEQPWSLGVPGRVLARPPKTPPRPFFSAVARSWPAHAPAASGTAAGGSFRVAVGLPRVHHVEPVALATPNVGLHANSVVAAQLTSGRWSSAAVGGAGLAADGWRVRPAADRSGTRLRPLDGRLRAA